MGGNGADGTNGAGRGWLLIAEWGGEIAERGVAEVFVGEDGLGGVDAPVYAERGVEDGDAPFGGGGVEIVALILEHCRLRQHREAVGEAAWHEKLSAVILRQLHGHVASVGRWACPEVDRHVEHRAPDAAHELGLREGGTLEMEPAHDSARGAALVVLHEVDLCDLLVELALGVALEEVATGVGENPRLYHHHSLYPGLYHFHGSFRLGRWGWTCRQSRRRPS